MALRDGDCRGQAATAEDGAVFIQVPGANAPGQWSTSRRSQPSGGGVALLRRPEPANAKVLFNSLKPVQHVGQLICRRMRAVDAQGGQKLYFLVPRRLIGQRMQIRTRSSSSSEMNEQMSGCILRVSVGMRDETRPARLTMTPPELPRTSPCSGPYPHVGVDGCNPPTPACNCPRHRAAQRGDHPYSTVHPISWLCMHRTTSSTAW